jgi:hypothetical protein
MASWGRGAAAVDGVRCVSSAAQTAVEGAYPIELRGASGEVSKLPYDLLLSHINWISRHFDKSLCGQFT